MKISIFGLGYVGIVSAACFAGKGHYVIGVDVNPAKIETINQGLAPIIEKDLSPLLAQAVKEGTLSAIIDTQEAVSKTDISIICVGTPSLPNGNLDLQYLQKVCDQIGKALMQKKDFHVVVIRSTVLPGTIHNVVIPLLEKASRRKVNKDFGICHNPEFLREGSAIDDFRHPARTIIGSEDDRSANLVAAIYEGEVTGEIIRCDFKTSEMIKYADNAWHATKVAFANEIGKLCKENAIDSHEVMEVFCKDTTLNLSPYYLKPGFAFGGSCLPKDLRALTYKGRSQDIELPLLNSVMESNKKHIEWGIKTIMDTGKKSIGILGFSFKAGTDDLRESPLVEVIERLLGKGFELLLYDANVRLSTLIGANRDYIYKTIPHIEKLMVETMDEVLSRSDTIVIGNNAPEFAAITTKLKPEQKIIDFIRIPEIETSHNNYHGICW